MTDPWTDRNPTAPTPRRRGGGREGHARSLLPPQRPWAQPRIRYRPTEVLSADELESIHQASLRVLAEIGMDFLDDGARDVLKAAGADVTAGQPPRPLRPGDGRGADPDGAVDVHAPRPNPEHDIASAATGPPSGRSAARRTSPTSIAADGSATGPTTRTCPAAQMLNSVHFFAGYPVEPIDIHPSVRHLARHLRRRDARPTSRSTAYSLGRQRNLDALEMVRIARGIDEATLDREPSIFTVINSQLAAPPGHADAPGDHRVLGAQPGRSCMTPFTLAGAMAPVTLAGALAEQNAEALAGIAMTQVVRPGAPVIYGGFTSNVDMQSGAPAFGTPEYMRTAMIGGQLARRYGVPVPLVERVRRQRASTPRPPTSSVFSLWGAIMGGVNMLMHGAAGWRAGCTPASRR